MNLRRVATRGAVTAGAVLGLLLASAPVKALPLAGDQTIVLLTSAGALGSAGISVGGLGSAVIGLDLAGRAEALFPITGGDLTGLAGTIEHDGSGLSLSGNGTTVSLENFLIDTLALQLFGDVSVNGGSVGNLPLFDIAVCTSLVGTADQCIDGDGSILLDGFKLSLTQGAAGALTEVFGLPDLTGAQIGVARIDVSFVPEPGTAMLLGLGLAVAASRRNVRKH